MEATYYSKELTCAPLDTYEEILAFLQDPPPWRSLCTPLNPHSKQAIRNMDINKNFGEAFIETPQTFCHFKAKSEADDIIPAIERQDIKKLPKTLVCHDFANGYHDDSVIDGTSNHAAYTFYNWGGIDIFCYFSHHLVTIPPLGWINVAHAHGVKVIGTLITEWSQGAQFWEDIFESEVKTQNFASALVAIAKTLKFDGWLLNVENKISKPKHLLEFVRHLHSILHQELEEPLLIWYDSVTVDGHLMWQNGLNDKNKAFFDACDGIFTNYSWSTRDVAKSALAAGDRLTDVYVGIDVWGRNFYGGGQFNTQEAVKVAHKHGCSLAIFAPAWTHEAIDDDTCDTYVVTEFDKRCKYHKFLLRDRALWDSIWPYLNTKLPSSLPFETSFCRGQGKKRRQYGEVISPGSWYNLRHMQYQLNSAHGPHGYLLSVLENIMVASQYGLHTDSSRSRRSLDMDRVVTYIQNEVHAKKENQHTFSDKKGDSVGNDQISIKLTNAEKEVQIVDDDQEDKISDDYTQKNLEKKVSFQGDHNKEGNSTTEVEGNVFEDSESLSTKEETNIGQLKSVLELNVVIRDDKSNLNRKERAAFERNEKDFKLIESEDRMTIAEVEQNIVEREEIISEESKHITQNETDFFKKDKILDENPKFVKEERKPISQNEIEITERDNSFVGKEQNLTEEAKIYALQKSTIIENKRDNFVENEMKNVTEDKKIAIEKVKSILEEQKMVIIEEEEIIQSHKDDDHSKSAIRKVTSVFRNLFKMRSVNEGQVDEKSDSDVKSANSMVHAPVTIQLGQSKVRLGLVSVPDELECLETFFEDSFIGGSCIKVNPSDKADPTHRISRLFHCDFYFDNAMIACVVTKKLHGDLKQSLNIELCAEDSKENNIKIVLVGEKYDDHGSFDSFHSHPLSSSSDPEFRKIQKYLLLNEPGFYVPVENSFGWKVSYYLVGLRGFRVMSVHCRTKLAQGPILLGHFGLCQMLNVTENAGLEQATSQADSTS